MGGVITLKPTIKTDLKSITAYFVVNGLLKTRQGTHDYRLYHKHYVALWDYVLNNIGKDIKFQYLGEDHPSNMTTDISKKMFPLEIL